MSTKVDKRILVNVPVSTAYNQWTQFEDFPQFMGGVKSVTQLSDDRLEWVAEIAGVKKLLTAVPVRKPNRQTFFRTHPDPDYRDQFPIVDFKDDQEEYIVSRTMVPEMNCARKLDAYRAWLCPSKVSAASRWRPKTLTSEWPVNISSM